MTNRTDFYDGVVIAGAGIGGLATALALQQHGFSSLIFERDADFDSRRQGYSLTIQKNGFQALVELGLGEEVLAIGMNATILGTTTYNNFGETILSTRKSINQKKRFINFTIPRQTLRQCLMNRLKSGTIQWNQGIVQYESLKQDEHHVRILLNDGSSMIARALIGCDGVHSQIRKQMFNDPLNYLGVWAMNGISAHHQHPSLVKQSIQMIDGNSRLFIKPFHDDRCMWQLTFKVPDVNGVSLDFDKHDSAQILTQAKSLTKTWHGPIPRLIDETPLTDLRFGPIFDRNPLNKIEKDVNCVTMLGDAVHPMSPFKGQGANQALVDAVTLVRCLSRHKDVSNSIEKAFDEFEKEMLDRSRIYVLRSRSMVDFLHTPDALSQTNMSHFLVNYV